MNMQWPHPVDRLILIGWEDHVRPFIAPPGSSEFRKIRVEGLFHQIRVKPDFSGPAGAVRCCLWWLKRRPLLQQTIIPVHACNPFTTSAKPCASASVCASAWAMKLVLISITTRVLARTLSTPANASKSTLP